MYLRYGKVKRGDAVFDLGADCSLAALDFADKAGKEGLVISFEPDPSNCDALLKNVEEHGLENVRPLGIGVWSTTGKIWLDADGSMGTLAVTAEGQPSRGERTEISVISLADLAAHFTLSRVDFVKMDIEGSEFEVVPKCGDFLEHFRPRWVIEVHDRKRMSEMTGVFKAKGYSTQVVSQNETHAYPVLVAEPIRWTAAVRPHVQLPDDGKINKAPGIPQGVPERRGSDEKESKATFDFPRRHFHPGVSGCRSIKHCR